MLVFPNAKINLGLNIVEKRSDGFHNIETIMLDVSLCDILEFVPAYSLQKNKLNITGLSIDSSIEDNLLSKSYNLLANDYNLPALNIHLHKIIPFGAGLGGGSSDAAFFMKALNDEFSLGISSEDLSELSSEIGSDCPFFFNNKAAFVSGRGDVIQAIDFSLSGYYLVIVFPGIKVNTKEAYSRVAPVKPKKQLVELIKMPIDNWKNNISNDFETSVFSVYPEIKLIKENLYSLGAVYASMTGSGAAVFGIFKQNINIADRFYKYFVWQEKLA